MATHSDELKGVRKLYEFSRLLLEGDESEDLLNRLVEAVRVITDADEVILFLIEGGSPKVHSVASDYPGDGISKEDVKPPGQQGALRYSETLVEEVIERGEPLLLENVGDDPRFSESRSIQMLAITSAMGAPLYHEGNLIGAIYAARKRVVRNFSEEHRELMTVAASQASLLLSRLASAEALRESDSRYRALVEASPSGIAVVQNDKLSFANQTVCRLCDCGAVAELVGLEVGELFDPWRSRSVLEMMRNREKFDAEDAWIRTGEAKSATAVEVFGRPVRFAGDEGMLLVISEVDMDDAMLDRRVRTDRLRVMGTMATTMGHEINNPLSYAYANIDYAVEELERLWGTSPGDEPEKAIRRDVMEGLNSAREGTERIRRVVDSMQNFANLEQGDGEVSSVRRPVKSSLHVARRDLGDDVTVELELEPTPPVELDAARLGQVFLNLMLNAADALEEVDGDAIDKRLTVRAHREEAEDVVVVEITDNGPGIPLEVRDQIFEPFVSTKSSQDGSGLGLAICKKIVDAARGDIEVESSPGNGSCFRVRLPVAVDDDDDRQRDPAGDSVDPQRDDGCARVLVVEPEPMLCRSLKRVLHNHDVAAVTTKGEAVEAMSGDDEFDVVLCELQLRRGLGRDLFKWIETQAPCCWERLVAVTPRKPDRQTRRYLEELPNRWVAKPFDLGELRDVINDMVTEPG